MRHAALAVLALLTLALGSAPGGAGSGAGAASVSFDQDARALGIAENGIDIWGVAAYDWNGDRCDDLYVGRHYAPPRLYRNPCPGKFVEETDRLRLRDDIRETEDRHSLAFADYDGDGRQDLFVSAGGDSRTHPGYDDQLYHQLADGNFEDVAPAEGMRNQPASGRFGLWFDYDGDGDLDLFVGHHLEPPEQVNRNLLWRNEGGHFVDVSAEARVNTLETSFSGAATDLDADGDLDLITVPGKKASVYRNQGNGTFDLTQLGVSVPAGIGSVGPADYDNDGDLDLFFSRPGKDSQLLRNDGGSWTDVTVAAGAKYRAGSSALWLDANNDGWLDLFLARVAVSGAKQPNVLLINQTDGTFVDDAPAAGVTGPTDVAAARVSAAWGDFDRNGRVDLVVLTKGSRRAVQLYVNRSQTGNRWITLRLQDPTVPNHQALGAKVWITAGGLTQYRELVAPIAQWSQSPAYLMVGVGASAVVARLEIRWPDGTVETYFDVATDRRYVATKGGSLEEDPS